MSPTVFRWRGYRFFFFSREEERMHVHVYCGDGQAKFWLEPEIALATNHGLQRAEISRLERVVEDRKDDIAKAWNDHFGR
ncbi:DUF4160 domain-containing protein [Candidatus Sumerlaeota bacterium]